MKKITRPFYEDKFPKIFRNDLFCSTKQKQRIQNCQYENTLILNLCTVGTFHTNGWTKFFSVQISTFCGQNNVFNDSVRPKWDPRRFFGKIRTGQFVGKIQATALSSLHGKNYRFMIAICGLHQLLVWSSEISSWCIRHFSSDPLPTSTPKRLKPSNVIRDLKILFGWGALGCLDFFSLESRDLGL